MLDNRAKKGYDNIDDAYKNFEVTNTVKEEDMPVSKTDFIRGLQCEKMLWLDAHAPELRIIPPEVQAKLDAGNEFGDEMMSVFGEFVETTARREDGRLHFSKMLETTKTLLALGEKVICEGSFSWYGNFCAADILKKSGDAYELYEVKNTEEIRREFLLDLAFQRLIIRKCGVAIASCFLILKDGENEKTEEQGCVERKIHNGFPIKIVDVSKQVRVLEKTVQENIFPFGKIKKKDAPMPVRSIGEHCLSPYRCWYFEHCHRSL